MKPFLDSVMTQIKAGLQLRGCVAPSRLEMPSDADQL
jgi:hypothetical protein